MSQRYALVGGRLSGVPCGYLAVLHIIRYTFMILYENTCSVAPISSSVTFGQRSLVDKRFGTKQSIAGIHHYVYSANSD